jgi:hypothetical protein
VDVRRRDEQRVDVDRGIGRGELGADPVDLLLEEADHVERNHRHRLAARRDHDRARPDVVQLAERALAAEARVGRDAIPLAGRLGIDLGVADVVDERLGGDGLEVVAVVAVQIDELLAPHPGGRLGREAPAGGRRADRRDRVLREAHLELCGLRARRAGERHERHERHERESERERNGSRTHGFSCT